MADDGLFAGRQFRAYREFSTTQTLRLTTIKPFILQAQSLYVRQGEARVVISTGGTPSGTWTAVTTLFPKNTVNPLSSGATIETGGTVAGGQEREVLAANAGGGSGANGGEAGQRVLAPGVYYITITVTGTTAGMYSIEFENMR